MMYHGTAVAILGVGILIQGPSHSGKSSTALGLLSSGGVLISDDQVVLSIENGVLMASPPLALVGLIEMRPLGIIAVPAFAKHPIQCVVSLTKEIPERLSGFGETTFLGHPVKTLSLHQGALGNVTSILYAVRTIIHMCYIYAP
jgi:HPr kinase/phosphorylase